MEEEENCSQTHTKLSFYGVREKNSDLFTEKLIFLVFLERSCIYTPHTNTHRQGIFIKLREENHWKKLFI